MKKNNHKKNNQGDLFRNFEPEYKSKTAPEKCSVTEKDLCEMSGGKVLTERKAKIESLLIALKSDIQKILELDRRHKNKQGVYQWKSTDGGGLKGRKLDSSEEVYLPPERSGEELVKKLREYGVMGDVKPDMERVKWYRQVFAEDAEKRRKKNK